MNNRNATKRMIDDIKLFFTHFCTAVTIKAAINIAAME